MLHRDKYWQMLGQYRHRLPSLAPTSYLHKPNGQRDSMHDNITWSFLVVHRGSPYENYLHSQLDTCWTYVASSVSWLRGNNISYDKPKTMFVDGKLNGHLWFLPLVNMLNLTIPTNQYRKLVLCLCYRCCRQPERQKWPWMLGYLHPLSFHAQGAVGAGFPYVPKQLLVSPAQQGWSECFSRVFRRDTLDSHEESDDCFLDASKLL